MLKLQPLNTFALSESDVISLKRDFGNPVEKISMKNAVPFYGISPEGMLPKERECRYFCVTMDCMQRSKAGSTYDFIDAAGRYYDKASDSGKRKALHLMDMSYNSPTFLKSMRNFVKALASKDIYINPTNMLYTLMEWDYKAEKRKAKFARMAAGEKYKDIIEENSETEQQ